MNSKKRYMIIIGLAAISIITIFTLAEFTGDKTMNRKKVNLKRNESSNDQIKTYEYRIKNVTYSEGQINGVFKTLNQNQELTKKRTNVTLKTRKMTNNSIVQKTNFSIRKPVENFTFEGRLKNGKYKLDGYFYYNNMVFNIGSNVFKVE